MGDTDNILSEEKQRELIESLAENLTHLRTKAEISRNDLAGFMGISCRSYAEIENREKTMSWRAYLSLLLFFDYNQKTHNVLRELGIFPDDIIKRINDKDGGPYSYDTVFPGVPEHVTEKLDEQAFGVIRDVVMIEYARCEKLTPEEIVRLYY